MPAEIAAVQDLLTGDDTLDWLLVAGQASGMKSDDLETTSFGHLIVANDTYLDRQCNSVWLQPDSDVVLPAGHETFLVNNDNELSVCAIVGDGICSRSDLDCGMIKVNVINTSSEPVLLKRGQRLARCCEAPPAVIDKGYNHWEDEQLLYNQFDGARAAMDQRSFDFRGGSGLGSDGGDAVGTNHLRVTEMERRRIQGLPPAKIMESINDGTLSVDTVTQCIIPCVTLCSGIGGADSGIMSAELEDDRIYKIFLAIDNDEVALAALRRRTNDTIPTAVHTLGVDVASTLGLILEHVPRDLCDHLFMYAAPPRIIRSHARHHENISKIETLRLADVVIALSRLLSPTATFVMEHDPYLEPSFRDKFEFCKVIDLGAVVSLPQSRKRLIVSNVPLELNPHPNGARKSITKALGAATVKSTYLQFSSNGTARPIAEPAFTVTRAPIRIGTDLKHARALNVTQTAKLQDLTFEDVQGCGNVSNVKRRTLIAAATPPCFARGVASSAAKFTGVNRIGASRSTPALVSACTEFVSYIEATHVYINATSFLDGAEVSKSDRARRAMEEHFEMDTDEEASAPSTTSTVAAAVATGTAKPRPHPAVQANEPCAKLYSTLTEEERADRRRAAQLYEKKWQPNFTDTYPASSADVLRLLNETGLPARAAAGELEDAENTLGFFQELITTYFPVMDNVFRVSGPTRMELKTSDVVRTRGFPLKDPAKFKAAKHIIDDLLKRDVIYHNPGSAYSSPMLLVPKKHKPGETDPNKVWRQVCDYRALNEVTMSENYGPPSCDACLHAIAGCKYKTLIDMEKAYWNLSIHEESSDYTTFVVPGLGSYAFKRMVMGLKNSSSVFQAHIDRVLSGALMEYCIAYIDDVAVYSNSLEEHKVHLDDVFARLMKAGHNLNLSKCVFIADEVEYLGYVLSTDGIKPSPRHAQGIDDMKLPTTLRELQCFLGLVNYERRFLKDFAAKMVPLTAASKRGSAFTGLSPDEEAAFHAIKAEIKEFVMASKQLYYPDFTREIEIHTDASKHAIGGWAFQRGPDGEVRPIAYVSRSVKEAEKAYYELVGTGTGTETREIELLALIYVLDELDYLLHGTGGVKCDTDHRNIVWLKNHARGDAKASKGNNRLLRWALKLDQYDNVEIRYRTGITNNVADAMSRLHRDRVDFADHYMLDVCELNTVRHYEYLDERAVDPTFDYKALGMDPLKARRFVISMVEMADPKSIPSLCEGPLQLPLAGGEKPPKGATPTDAPPPHAPRRALPSAPTSPLSLDVVGAVEDMKTLPHAVVPIPTVERIQKAQERDPAVVKIRNALLQVEHERLEASGADLDQPVANYSANKGTALHDAVTRYSLRNGIVCCKPSSGAFQIESRGRLERVTIGHEVYLIPDSDDLETRLLRRDLIEYCHAGLQGGHHGVSKTVQLLRARFFWKGISIETRQFVQACIHCRLAKTPVASRFGYLQSFDATEVFDTVAIDILSFKGDASRGEKGERHVLVMVDIFSHFLITVPLTDNKMKTICHAVIHKLFIPWGAPRKLVADNEFTAKDFDALLGLLKVEAAFVTAYHSSSNPAERYCQHVQVMLRTFLSEFPNRTRSEGWLGEWVDYLPYVTAAHNSAPYTGTGEGDSGVTPFEIVTGRRYRWPQDLGVIEDPTSIAPPTTLHEYWSTKRERMREISDWVRRIVVNARASNSETYNLNRRFFTLNPTDLVIVRVPSRKGKLSLQFIGPCEVLARESDLIYRVKHNKSGREMRVHIDRLRRHHPLVKLTDDDARASEQLATPAPSSPLVGRRVNAHFGQHGWHHGTITTVDDYAHVVFDDGDEHDYKLDEVKRILLPIATLTDSPNAPEQHVEENDMAILRHRATSVVYVGKVVDTFPETSEFNFHFYAHQPYDGKKYDVHLPLRERSVRPEYYYNVKKSGGLRQHATLKPRGCDKPHIYLIDLDEYELLANRFTLDDDGSIPIDILRTIPGAAVEAAVKRRKVA